MRRKTVALLLGVSILSAQALALNSRLDVQTTDRSVKKANLGWALVGITGNTFGVFAGFAVFGTIPPLGFVIMVKSAYGVVLGGLNSASALMGLEPESSGALFNDLVEELFPRNGTAQAIASAADLAVDLGTLLAWREASAVLKMGRPIDPLLGPFFAPNPVGSYKRATMFGARTESRLKVLIGTQTTKTTVDAVEAAWSGRHGEPQSPARKQSTTPNRPPPAQTPNFQPMRAAQPPQSATVFHSQTASMPQTAHVIETQTAQMPRTARMETAPASTYIVHGCEAGKYWDSTQQTCYDNDSRERRGSGGSDGGNSADVPPSTPEPANFGPNTPLRGR